MDLSQTFSTFQQQAMNAIASASDSESLEQVRIEFLGKKQGKLKDLQTTLGKVPLEQRPEVGAELVGHNGHALTQAGSH